MKIRNCLILCIIILSCQENKVVEEKSNKRKLNIEATAVKIDSVRFGNFHLEIVCNGKVHANRISEIRFPPNETIATINIKNGDFVKRGAILATLDNRMATNRLERSKSAIEKASIDLDDQLINYGYRLKDSLKVPKTIMKMALIKSNLNNARYDYIEALAAYNHTVIRAPFNGKVANIEGKPFTSTDNYKTFCTVLDDSRMNVAFEVIETELRHISIGSEIEISDFADGKKAYGIVTSLNPTVEKSGLIKMFGDVVNNDKMLLDGMNVKVIIKKTVKNTLYIAKSAAVERDGKKVVFTFVNNEAKWNYVETGFENSSFIAILNGLDAKDKVIITNNLTLAHDSKVVLKASD